MSTALLIIDPQNDFCDPEGSLYVPGAEHDMCRLADMIRRLGDQISEIVVSLDSHSRVDIAHPLWWSNPEGDVPDPFTQIRSGDLLAGRWTTRDPLVYEHTLNYLLQLEAKGRYTHTVWPEHCLIGTPGHNVFPELLDALMEWEAVTLSQVTYITKGESPLTEHFSAVKAEIGDQQINPDIGRLFQRHDRVLLAGEASTHCWRFTVEDMGTLYGDQPHPFTKAVALEDCISPVPDPVPGLFSQPTNRAFEAFKSQGLRFDRSTHILP